MKFKSEELSDLIKIREEIDRWTYEAFENQAENEDFQRKKVRKRYKKEIEKTRNCLLGVWWVDFKSVIKYKEPKVEYENIGHPKGIVGFFRKLFRLDKKKVPEIEFPVSIESKDIDELLNDADSETLENIQASAAEQKKEDEQPNNLEGQNATKEKTKEETQTDMKDEQGA